MSVVSWVSRSAEDGESAPLQLLKDDEVEFRLAGDPTVRRETAGNLYWAPEGGIVAWRKVATVPVGVGDVNGTALGSAARFNGSKPDLSLIPASIVGGYADHARTLAAPPTEIYWPVVLAWVGAFQMRDDGRHALRNALHAMDNDGLLWADCARVFDYGRRKYSAWNWARGQAWSIPIASALRHIVFGTLKGEEIDPESGLPHRGHIACNIVMLLWFIDHYPAGDDRFTPPALPHV